MATIVAVKMSKVGRIYYFDAAGLDVKVNLQVIAGTPTAQEIGRIVDIERQEDSHNDIDEPMKKLLRIATEQDKRKVEENEKKAKQALKDCAKRVAQHNLNMKLVDAEYMFDGSKILFYFTAEGRVDFRDLVKDLASLFKTRIELRQIGVRDKAKSIGGLGVCGRELCCKCCLKDLEPVSINMAKEQCLSLNPSKISGSCGRLMCCLRYEQPMYEKITKNIPKVGSIVITEDGKGMVQEVYVLKEQIKVKLDDSEKENEIKIYNVKDVKLIKEAPQDQDISEQNIDLKELKELEGD